MEGIGLGRADCGRFESVVRKEWLVTNGLGGYAAGTVGGVNTRRYHGLLIAALRPPQERTLTLAKIDTWAYYDGKSYPLFTNEYIDGTIDPHGYRYLESFHLEGLIPVWLYALADARLEQRIWMDHGHNTTYINYTLARATYPLSLKSTPLCTYRDHHSHSHGEWGGKVRLIAGGVEVEAFEGALPYRVLTDKGKFNHNQDCYWNFRHRVEGYRGLDEGEDLFSPGFFEHTLHPGETLTLSCSLEEIAPGGGLTALKEERKRQENLLKAVPADEPAWVRHLALASDQFIVRRSLDDEDMSASSSEGEMADIGGMTIIAGYPWFGDWGRDTMIALPGLTLTTKRPEVAADILRTFNRYVQRGMLPNRFPDGDETPEYNTVDATLWYFHAIHHYLIHTGDLSLIEELYPTLVEIVEHHERGSRYNIRVDADDGLLFAGEPGVQLTWMDAKVGDWVVTPRIGKPVEVNALWHNALRVMADLSKRLGKSKVPGRYREAANLVADNFRQRFWYEEGRYLYDVIDGPEGEIAADGVRYDHRLMPNQIFAVSLPFKLLEDAEAKAVVDVCARHLWTSYGLRSLAASDPAYTGCYGGAPLERDSVYHRGTVWGWLLGGFVSAHYRVYNDAAAARSFLTSIEHHLSDACLGSISEIFDGNPPHTPRGCFAQAWSVAEVVRVWKELGNKE